MTQDSAAERRRARMAFMDDKKGTQAMNTPKLKPCPFCGGGNALVLPATQNDKDRLYPFVRCFGCFLDMPGRNEDYSTDGKTAIAAWNTRADLSQAAIAAAMMGAVKPLKWFRESGDKRQSFAKADTGVYRVCAPNNSGLWMWFRYSSWPKSGCILGIGGEMREDAFQDEGSAKAAAEADWQARNAAIRVIPTDAMAALAERERLAEQRGFDRAKEQAAQIIKTAYPCETGSKWAAQIRAMEGSE